MVCTVYVYEHKLLFDLYKRIINIPKANEGGCLLPGSIEILKSFSFMAEVVSWLQEGRKLSAALLLYSNNANQRKCVRRDRNKILLLFVIVPQKFYRFIFRTKFSHANL